MKHKFFSFCSLSTKIDLEIRAKRVIEKEKETMERNASLKVSPLCCTVPPHCPPLSLLCLQKNVIRCEQPMICNCSFLIYFIALD